MRLNVVSAAQRKPGELGTGAQSPDRGRASLRAEGVIVGLGDGVGQAQQGGAVVVDAVDGGLVAGDGVGGAGLDDEPGR
jgi:hypothetical protein